MLTVVINCKNKHSFDEAKDQIDKQTYKNITIVTETEFFESGSKRKHPCDEYDYVLAIDEEDRISVDYCRMLVRKAEETGSEIVTSDIAYYDHKTDKYVYSNLSPLRSICVNWDNKELNDCYHKYSEHTADFGMAFGKLIAKGLMKRTLENSCISNVNDLYKEAVKHANSFCNIHGAYYYRKQVSKKDRASFFNSITTPICSKYDYYEEMKESIASEKCKAVSFDVFDTLVLRNVYAPTDLFHLLDREYEKVFELASYNRFQLIRIAAENVCRKRVFEAHGEYEDITIDEIYTTIADLYNLNLQKLELLKKKEIELEYEFCIPRQTGKELFELAKDSGKKIVITSDMYLSKEDIKGILDKCGYKEITDVYVSSETRRGKYTGSVYKHLAKWLRCHKEEIVHIGDNYKTDVEQAIKYGIKAYHLPKCSDLFWGNEMDCVKGAPAAVIFGLNGSENDYSCSTRYNFGVRCLLSQVVNKFFDNPFTGFNSESDFDVDPYFIGYFALGMHLWSVAKWIKQNAGDYRKIHFLSRDGYVIKKVYDIINKGNSLTPSEYTYMSRNLIVLCDIEKPDDLWSFREKLGVYQASPAKYVRILSPCIAESVVENIKMEIKKAGISYENAVENEESFAATIRILQKYVDWELLFAFRSNLKSYFETIFRSNECIVDAGYNGRVESAIAKLCGIKLDSFYFHVAEDKFYDSQYKYGFSNKCFYNSHPITSYLVREQFISKLDPPIKGIEFNNGNSNIMFGNADIDEETEYITNICQNAAVEFAEDIAKVFGDYIEMIGFRRGDASRPFDYLCNYGKDLDINIFSHAEFEDDFGLSKNFNLSQYWKENLQRSNMQMVNNRNADDYEIFKKYYLKAERFLPKNSIRRAVIRKIVKLVLRET